MTLLHICTIPAPPQDTGRYVPGAEHTCSCGKLFRVVVVFYGSTGLPHYGWRPA